MPDDLFDLFAPCAGPDCALWLAAEALIVFVLPAAGLLLCVVGSFFGREG